MTTPTITDLEQRISKLQDSYDSLNENHNRLMAFVFQYLISSGADPDFVDEVFESAKLLRKTVEFELTYRKAND